MVSSLRCLKMVVALSLSGAQAFADAMKDMPHLKLISIGKSPIGVEGRLGEEASLGGNGG